MVAILSSIKQSTAVLFFLVAVFTHFKWQKLVKIFSFFKTLKNQITLKTVEENWHHLFQIVFILIPYCFHFDPLSYTPGQMKSLHVICDHES